MKTNLDQFFKTDKSMESEGIWLEFGKARFRVKRFGGYNSQKVKLALAKHFKPFSRQAELGTLEPEQENKILAMIFIEASLVTWEGVEMEGKEVPYSVEAALSLFTELPELFQEIQRQAQLKDNFKVEMGNS